MAATPSTENQYADRGTRALGHLQTARSLIYDAFFAGMLDEATYRRISVRMDRGIDALIGHDKFVQNMCDDLDRVPATPDDDQAPTWRWLYDSGQMSGVDVFIAFSNRTPEDPAGHATR